MLKLKWKLQNKNQLNFYYCEMLKKCMKKLTLSLLIICASSLAFSQDRLTAEDYINRYKNDAIKDMLKMQVPASITLAQGMYESENGNSDLARIANNHFGIKCHTDWSGDSYHKDDDAKDECFRKYKSVLESFDDHSLFLRSRDRYAFLFEYKITDYKSWAHGLKKAGYATNPSYAHKLIELIERYGLNELDIAKAAETPFAIKDPAPKMQPVTRDVVLSDTPATKNMEKRKAKIEVKPYTHYAEENNVKYVIAKSGDSWISIAKENEMMLWQVLKYNDAEKNDPIREGTIVYIKPKRNSAKQSYHIVQPGQTMRDISQLYAVKLNALYKKNQLEPGISPEAGTKIRLSD